MDDMILENAAVASSALSEQEELRLQLELLHQARMRLQQFKAELEERLSAPELQGLRDCIALETNLSRGYDARVRTLAMMLFAQDGAAKKLYGCELIHRKQARILDSQAAFNYALEHNHDLLLLNEGRLEDLATKLGIGPGMERFVEVYEEPAIRIPTNIAKHLED